MFYPIFLCICGLYCDDFERKLSCLIGCTKRQSPRIITVLHCRPPNGHIFYTDPSVVAGIDQTTL